MAQLKGEKNPKLKVIHKHLEQPNQRINGMCQLKVMNKQLKLLKVFNRWLKKLSKKEKKKKCPASFTLKWSHYECKCD